MTVRTKISTIAAVILSALLPARAAASGIPPAEQQREKLVDFFEYLDRLYVDTLDHAALVEDAIVAVLSQLDPHSTYSSPEEMRSLNETYNGSFGGVGIEFDVLNDTLAVIRTTPGSPAERAGIAAGDRIVAVDGKPVIGIRKYEVAGHLRGPHGSLVDLDIVRRGQQTRRLTIRRDDIPITSVDAAYTPAPGVGYIRVNRFAGNTMTEFRDAYESLGKPGSLILDLRGNSGGLLEQAVELSEFFLPYDALIVSFEGRAVFETAIKARRRGAFSSGSGNVIVLIDNYSASASEIVAGAIQDWDRGLVIGRPSFGKGLVQRQIPLGDGSAVRITVARYHTPSGRVIQRPFRQGHSDEYYEEFVHRSLDPAYVDSLNASAPRYRTLRTGRTVLGGGGITPDLTVPVDTTRDYTYWNSLIEHGTVNRYVNLYLDSHRTELLRRWPDAATFAAGYETSPAMLESLAELGLIEGISPTAQSSMPDNAPTIIKAMLARKLWDTTAYYRIINASDDPEFAEAMTVIHNWSEYARLLEP